MNEPQLAVYRGTCDASAAARIGGTSFFVTASDEDYAARLRRSCARSLRYIGKKLAAADARSFRARKVLVTLELA